MPNVVGAARSVGRSIPRLLRLSSASLFALPAAGGLLVIVTVSDPAGLVLAHAALSLAIAAVLATALGSVERSTLSLLGFAAMGSHTLQAAAFHLSDIPLPLAQTAVWLVAGLIWTGQWLGHRYCLIYMAPTAATYASALILNQDTGPDDWVTALLLWSVAVGIGLTTAFLQRHLRAQRRRARRRGELLNLVAASTRHLITDDPEVTLRASAESVLALGFDGVEINLLDKSGGSLVLRLGEPIDLDVEVERLASPETTEMADGLVVAIPLHGAGSTVGYLAARVSTGSARLDNHEVEALELIALHLGRALELAQQVQHDRLSLATLGEESRQDPLTSLGNRRVAEEIISSLRADDVIVVIDLDHFKEINDRFGHAAGDELLLAFAAHLLASLRPTDSAARWGGDEFLVVLRRAGGSAQRVLDRILSDWTLASPDASFSAGYAIHLGEGNGQATFEAADAALYTAKARGRRCVVGSGSVPPAASDARGATSCST